MLHAAAAFAVRGSHAASQCGPGLTAEVNILMSDQDVFDSSMTFGDMKLRDSVLKGVEQAEFVHPTDIQVQLIPAVLEGRDVIGQAKTGTGKTAAFALPLLHLCDKDTPMQALILTPTRELAAQVAAEIQELGQFTPIRAVCIIGGESMRDQIKNVKDGGHIIVGTPGRVMDMHARGQIHFDNLRFAVLDEVDRMLDIGFREDIRKILKQIKRDHQTVFVSATIDEEIDKLARSFMQPDAVRISSVGNALTVAQVTQKYLPVQPWDKRSLLLHLLRYEKPDTTVVFCKTKATVHKVTKYLRDKGANAREIHGDLQQSKRNTVMNSMRSGKLDVLIASDLAARGLDIDHISHVINYDLPEDPEIYVHRIGRTARAGRKGTAWTFVTPDQGQLLTEVEKLTGVMIEQLDYPDFKPGPVPKEIAGEQQQRQRREQAVTERAQTDRALSPELQGLSEAQLKAMFPDGKIPSAPPARGLGSRLRTRRR
jgi:ATP-dependent RNA helicase DeaD